jgi:hypothetical protein
MPLRWQICLSFLVPCDENKTHQHGKPYRVLALQCDPMLFHFLPTVIGGQTTYRSVWYRQPAAEKNLLLSLEPTFRRRIDEKSELK